MTSLKNTLLLACAVSLTFACSEKTSNQEENLHEMHEPESSESTESIPAASVSFSNDETTAIINSYLDLKDQLVVTDGEKASVEAKKMLSVLENSQTSNLESIKVAAQQIASSIDPEEQRVAFDLLSQQVLILAKSEMLTEGKLYKQYCPMAKNNTGAFWLSASDQIRNPYFGDKMLTCGSVEEEI